MFVSVRSNWFMFGVIVWHLKLNGGGKVSSPTTTAGPKETYVEVKKPNVSEMCLDTNGCTSLVKMGVCVPKVKEKMESKCPNYCDSCGSGYHDALMDSKQIPQILKDNWDLLDKEMNETFRKVTEALEQESYDKLELLELSSLESTALFSTPTIGLNSKESTAAFVDTMSSAVKIKSNPIVSYTGKMLTKQSADLEKYLTEFSANAKKSNQKLEKEMYDQLAADKLKWGIVSALVTAAKTGLSAASSVLPVAGQVIATVASGVIDGAVDIAKAASPPKTEDDIHFKMIETKIDQLTEVTMAIGIMLERKLNELGAEMAKLAQLASVERNRLFFELTSRISTATFINQRSSYIKEYRKRLNVLLQSYKEYMMHGMNKQLKENLMKSCVVDQSTIATIVKTLSQDLNEGTLENLRSMSDGDIRILKQHFQEYESDMRGYKMLAPVCILLQDLPADVACDRLKDITNHSITLHNNIASTISNYYNDKVIDTRIKLEIENFINSLPITDLVGKKRYKRFWWWFPAIAAAAAAVFLDNGKTVYKEFDMNKVMKSFEPDENIYNLPETAELSITNATNSLLIKLTEKFPALSFFVLARNNENSVLDIELNKEDKGSFQLSQIRGNVEFTVLWHPVEDEPTGEIWENCYIGDLSSEKKGIWFVNRPRCVRVGLTVPKKYKECASSVCNIEEMEKIPSCLRHDKQKRVACFTEPQYNEIVDPTEYVSKISALNPASIGKRMEYEATQLFKSKTLYNKLHKDLKSLPLGYCVHAVLSQHHSGEILPFHVATTMTGAVFPWSYYIEKGKLEEHKKTQLQEIMNKIEVYEREILSIDTFLSNPEHMCTRMNRIQTDAMNECLSIHTRIKALTICGMARMLRKRYLVTAVRRLRILSSHINTEATNYQKQITAGEHLDLEMVARDRDSEKQFKTWSLRNMTAQMTEIIHKVDFFFDKCGYIEKIPKQYANMPDLLGIDFTRQMVIIKKCHQEYVPMKPPPKDFKQTCMKKMKDNDELKDDFEKQIKRFMAKIEQKKKLKIVFTVIGVMFGVLLATILIVGIVVVIKRRKKRAAKGQVGKNSPGVIASKNQLKRPSFNLLKKGSLGTVGSASSKDLLKRSSSNLPRHGSLSKVGSASSKDLLKRSSSNLPRKGSLGKVRPMTSKDQLKRPASKVTNKNMKLGAGKATGRKPFKNHLAKATPNLQNKQAKITGKKASKQFFGGKVAKSPSKNLQRRHSTPSAKQMKHKKKN